MAAVANPSTLSHDSGNADLYGGILLCIATIAALVVANSPLGVARF
jgi:Na+/H+ antiporter NhaA